MGYKCFSCLKLITQPTLWVHRNSPISISVNNLMGRFLASLFSLQDHDSVLYHLYKWLSTYPLVEILYGFPYCNSQELNMPNSYMDWFLYFFFPCRNSRMEIPFIGRLSARLMSNISRTVGNRSLKTTGIKILCY